MSADDAIRFLASSPNRVTLLSALDTEPGPPAALAERCSIARSSLHRNLSALCERGWARKCNGQYRSTAAGEMVLDAYRDLAETVSQAEAAAPFLDALVAGGLTLTPEELATATVTRATEGNPYAPVHRYAERVGAIDSTEFRGLTPIVSPVFNEAHAALLERGVDSEVILGADALSASKTAYGDRFAEAMRTDALSVRVLDESPPLGLSVLDDTAFAGAYEDERLLACLESDSPGFVERVSALYEEYSERAYPVDAEGVPLP
ncbi:helix-turn-helix transcriptional regulator [Natronorarus salvus]|uniref:helix-turn-helix transcriptional regulator n=1 Tax=Natronorarus salvus TaxID=3117733 RepID=UPI002F266F5A